MYGGLAGFSAGDALSSSNTDVVAVTAGLKSDWHFRPATNVDPWVSLGGGFRWLAIDDRTSGDSKDRALLGLDLLRVQAGVDYRVTPTLSIGPVISATATTFIKEDTEMSDGYQDIDDRRSEE